MSQESSIRNRPVKSFRSDEGNIQVAVWARVVGENTYWDVSVQRGYRDKTGQWRNTSSVGSRYLPVLIEMLQAAAEFIEVDREARGRFDFGESQSPEEIQAERDERHIPEGARFTNEDTRTPPRP